MVLGRGSGATGFFRFSLALVLVAATSCQTTRREKTSEVPDPPAPETELTAQVEEPLPSEIVISETTLGPGDVIAVSVYRHPDLSASLSIPPSGIVFLPLAGEIQASGQSPTVLRRTITEKLDRFVVDPQVNVAVTVRRSQRILVLGEVQRPGVFAMDDPVTALEMVAQAGGFTNEATRRRVVLLRQQGQDSAATVLDLRKVLKGEDFAQNVTMQKGDILFVPKSTVANIDRFASHLNIWLSPILRAESAVLLGFDINDRTRIDSATIVVGN